MALQVKAEEFCKVLGSTKNLFKFALKATNIVKDEKGDLFADSHSILARWRNYFSQLLNIHGVNDFRQTEIHTAEPLVPVLVPLRLSWLLKS